MSASQNNKQASFAQIASQVVQRKRKLTSMSTMSLFWSAGRRRVMALTTLRRAGLLALITASSGSAFFFAKSFYMR